MALRMHKIASRRCRAMPLFGLAAIFLFAGAALNIAAAWLLVSYGPGQYREMDLSPPLRWPRPVPDRWGAPTHGVRNLYLGRHDETIVGTHHERIVMIAVFRAGWPMPTLEYEYWVETRELYDEETGRLIGREMIRDTGPTSPWRLGMENPVVRLQPGPPRHLPLVPIASGMVINTGIYAMLVACTWFGVPALYRQVRAVRRRSRGDCTGCGYSRAGLADDLACPECGTMAKP